MKCKELFERIDSLEEKYLKITTDVCDIESPTLDKKGVDEVGKYFIDRANELGFKVEVYPQEVAGDVVVITMNENSNKAPVALSFHMDTVHPKGLFGYPPTREEGDNLIGPGVVDCKGGGVGALLAMEALKDIGYDKRPIILLLQSDEETGSSTSKRATINYICQKAKDSVAFLNLEGHVKGEMCLERKGILRFRFTVRGKACHSSRCYVGANAVTEACYKIIKLEEMKDPEGLTCNCGVINGGTVANSVAETCTFLADVRFSTKEEMEKARAIAKEVAENITVEGCSCDLEEISSRPAMEKDEKNYQLANFLNEVYEKEGLPILIPKKYTGGSDTAYTTNAGIPSIDCLGSEGANIHSEREYMKKSSIKECAKRLASVIMYI